LPIQSTQDLKQFLYDAYGGFADKRIKNIDKGKLYIIDDRTPSDEDAAGKLFLWFCQIFAEVLDAGTVRVTLRGSVPRSPLVTKWLASNGAEQANGEVQFSIRRGEEEGLGELARVFRAIVRPGAHYAVSSYKYVCPRTAASIERLQSVLKKAWGGS